MLKVHLTLILLIIAAGSQAVTGESSQGSALKRTGSKKKRGVLNRKKSTASLKSLDPSEEELIEKEYEKLVQADNKTTRYAPDQMQKMASLKLFP